MAISKSAVRQLRHMEPRCAAISGLMYARKDLARTHAELERVLETAGEHDGIVPRNEKDHHPDAMANLWFLRAIHEFGRHAAELSDAHQIKYFNEGLLPPATRIVQRFFAEHGLDGLRMDDGGMLMPHHASASVPKTGPAISHPQSLRINLLWYNALESTARALNALVNRAGRTGAAGMNSTAHHFERLASRLRRSFTKAFWCEEHASICTQAARLELNHGAHADPDQLLAAVLPESPLPRTKQRQVVSRIAAQSLGSMGVLFRHPMHGVVESPLHLVWLARGMAHEDRAAAARLLEPLAVLREAAKKMIVHPCYRDGKVVPHGSHKTDPLASAEILGALEQFNING